MSTRTSRTLWILVALLLALRLGVTLWPQEKAGSEGPVIVHDTVTVFQTRVDTVVRFVDRIRWKQARPETVVLYRPIRLDSLYRGRSPETLLGFRLAPGRLELEAVRPDSQRRYAVRRYLYALDPYASEVQVLSRGTGFFREAEPAMDPFPRSVSGGFLHRWAATFPVNPGTGSSTQAFVANEDCAIPWRRSGLETVVR